MPFIGKFDPRDAFQRHALPASGSAEDADPACITVKVDIQLEIIQFLFNLYRDRQGLPPPDMLHLLS